MAQGSRFSAPKFNGGGLWDPRQPGVAWPEPIEDQPYVEGTNGMSGGCGCGGTSGVGQLIGNPAAVAASAVSRGSQYISDRNKAQAQRGSIDFSKFLAPSISNIQRIRPDVLKAIRNTDLLDRSTKFYTPAVNFALTNIAKQEAEAKKKKKMLIIGGAVVIGVGLIFMANR